jgi:predicted MFS family arabinose efflux permease
LAVGIAPAAGIIGCITTGNVVAIGRRKLMIILGIVFLIGSSFAMVGNYGFFVTARLIKGLCMGYYTSLTPLYGLVGV